MQSSADVLTADPATTERAKVLGPFGFTERQARFLATVMLHSGVFVGRQYAAFAGIMHGQKVHDFIEKLLVRRFVTPIELGSTGRTRIFHVHHQPLYAAIGEPDNRNRRRVTVDRAIERLMVLDGVLEDRSVTWLGSEREKRRYFHQRLGDGLRDDEYPRLVFGQRPNVTVRYFSDKLPIARRANVRPGLHILRHSFCSHLAMRGAPARAIQELAGHQDLGTTQRYTHLSPAALDAAIRLLETGTEMPRAGRGEIVEAGTEGPKAYIH